ncbi:hypothetical protein I0P70_04935 [Pontibacter sp. FD36]|uniref:hypothetical protein n=1 Tax=Pontibacter sp. FD36 TaxID=2789860 RepID=UPI0018AADE09|nr:hypothetical protein [Pontibacter sp. FD36]MBF8962583.1 hypothetical protein [Pontibacter sp. FD36]
MIRLLLIFIFLAPFTTFACDADPPPVALEFLKAKYVFWGQATSKVYAKDSLTYNVSFTIAKHFKQETSLPVTLSYTFNSGGEITGRYSSCDYGVALGQNWLIYTYEHDGVLTFGHHGSNSKPVKSLEAIPEQELEILQSGHAIDYRNILFDGSALRAIRTIGYIGPSPKMQLASLLAHIDSKKYGLAGRFSFENFIARIDSLGNITQLFIPDRQAKLEHHQMYDVQAFTWSPLEDRNALQNDLLQALKASRQWEPARFMGKAVNSQIHFQVHIDDKGKISILAFY